MLFDVREEANKNEVCHEFGELVVFGVFELEKFDEGSVLHVWFFKFSQKDFRFLADDDLFFL